MLALSSRRAGHDSVRLCAAAEVAGGAGFSFVHAAEPPLDASVARAAADRVGVAIAGVSTAPIADRAMLSDGLDRAAEAGRAMRESRVVVDLGPYRGKAKETREASVDGLARDLYAAFARWGGVRLAVRAGSEKDALLGREETEWLLDALSSRGLSLWLDPVRARALDGDEAPLAWAERFARRTAGLFVHGAGPRGIGFGLPEEGGVDWKTLRGVLPTRLVPVLDVGPEPSEADVVETRRRFEEVFGY